jgi:plasmid stabilization system protein ParE
MRRQVIIVASRVVVSWRRQSAARRSYRGIAAKIAALLLHPGMTRGRSLTVPGIHRRRRP